MQAQFNFGGQPGMTTQTTVTETSVTGPGAGMVGGGDDPGKKSQDLNERFEYRKKKLVEYKGLIDFLATKGVDVTAMNAAHAEATLTPEEEAKGLAVFQEIMPAMMSFDMAKIMSFQPKLAELEAIDNAKESAFTRLELLLKEQQGYEEIRRVFTTTTSAPEAGITANVSVSGVPAPTPAAGGDLEARVAALETQNAALRAEFDAYKMTAGA